MNPDGLEMFISILKRLDFTYLGSILCLDMPIMTCPSRGKKAGIGVVPITISVFINVNLL